MDLFLVSIYHQVNLIIVNIGFTGNQPCNNYGKTFSIGPYVFVVYNIMRLLSFV